MAGFEFLLVKNAGIVECSLLSCAVSSAVERLLHTQEVAGSNPAPRTTPVSPHPAPPVTISSVYNLAASGMQAAVVRQNAAARNSANLLSEDPRRLVVSQTELSSGGTRAAAAPVESLADPVADAVDRLLSVYAFKANAVSLRTADKMAGTVLNVRA